VADATGRIDAEFVVRFPSFDDIVIRPFDVERDAGDVAEWVNREHAHFWGMTGFSREQVRQRYGPTGLGGDRAYIAQLAATGRKIMMFITYRVADDVLGRYVDRRPGDLGIHLLMAPPDEPVRHLTFHAMKAIQFYAFSDPQVRRLLAEPDIRNLKVHRRFLQAGYRLRQVLHLPHKTARLAALTRDEFTRLDQDHPDDAAARGVMSASRARLHHSAGRVLRRLGLTEWWSGRSAARPGTDR
jgi:RimJ/RimL family protein N-acetyltransferase